MKKFKIPLISFFFLLVSLLVIYKNTNYISQDQKLLKVHYIDVDQGDSTLIETNNKSLLIDVGPKSSKDKLLKYLKSKKIKEFDYIFITHPHEDHSGNLPYILKEFKVKKIFTPIDKNKSKEFLDILELSQKYKTPVEFINKDFLLNLSEEVALSIFPAKKNNYENLNDLSPIIRMDFKKDSFLFTGDNEIEGEFEGLKNNIDCDVLKVGHHGSNTSSNDFFLNEATPKIAVISCGKNNKFNHPNKNMLNRLKTYTNTIYRTDEDGTIVLTSSGDSTIKIEKK